MIKRLIEKLRGQPEKPQERFYGGNGTIHDTGYVDVVLDENGNVAQVWFRCAVIPFKQSNRRVPVSERFDNALTSPIEGIVFKDEN
jgi:hypothetical protein